MKYAYLNEIDFSMAGNFRLTNNVSIQSHNKMGLSS
ncbi:uncharacterized protein METZ01_LOCUS411752, partial [marine metagenome]